MVIEETRDPVAITIQGEVIVQVEQVIYLGMLINTDGSNENDIWRRIEYTSQAFEGYGEAKKLSKKARK